jgi:hypothetical protein
MLTSGRNEVSSLQLSIDEPLSPELALVCPELAERARRLLPEPGWLAPVVRLEPPVPVRTSRLATLMLALFAVATTVPPLLFVALRTPTVHG